MKLKLRVFRAIDDIGACHAYLEGHRRRMTEFGLGKLVKSISPEWIHAGSYAIVIEDEEDGRIHSGVRIQVRTPSVPLPIERACAAAGPQFHNVLLQFNGYSVAEYCGWWCSKELAKKGTNDILIRAGLAIADRLGLQCLFALSAPHTTQKMFDIGFELIPQIGNNGQITYPKKDMLATACILTDIVGMPLANTEEREAIWSLRKQPLQVVPVKYLQHDYTMKIDLTAIRFPVLPVDLLSQATLHSKIR